MHIELDREAHTYKYRDRAKVRHEDRYRTHIGKDRCRYRYQADKQAKISISFYKSFQSPPSVQPEVQQTSIVESAEDLQSEFTVDVQENFSAPEPEPPRRSPRKPLGICNKYLTPEVPKKIKSRLDKGSSSTPNLQPSREAPQTIKELINCAFGFESEDDLEERFVLSTCK